MDLTLGRETYDDPFHAEAIRGPFTKNIGTRFADVQDEIAVAFKEHIPVTGDGNSPPSILLLKLIGHRMGQSHLVFNHNEHCMQGKQPDVCGPAFV